IVVIFNAHAEPDVWIAVSPIVRQALNDPVRSFRQQLPVKPGRLPNQRPELLPFTIDDGVFERPVCHGRTEHTMASLLATSRLVPPEGFGPVLFAECAAPRFLAPNIETIAMADRVCVAVCAAGADLPATPGEIPGVVGPRNERFFSHELASATTQPLTVEF